MFFVAALSSLSLWILEAELKQHQMQHYPRMRSIEVACFPNNGAPAIDLSWNNAKELAKGKIKSIFEQPKPRVKLERHQAAFFLPHVMFPHILTVFFGLLFGFLVARQNCILSSRQKPNNQD